MHADQILPKEALDYPTSGKFKIEVWQSMFNSVAPRSEFIGRLFHAGAIIGELINYCDAEYYKVTKSIAKANLCDYIAFVNYKTMCARQAVLEKPEFDIDSLNEDYFETLRVLIEHNKSKSVPYFDDFIEEIDQAVSVVSQRSYLLNLWKKVRDFNYGFVEDAQSILFYPLDRTLEFGRVAAVTRAEEIGRQIGLQAIRDIEKYGEQVIVLRDAIPQKIPTKVSLDENNATFSFGELDKDYHFMLFMMTAQIPFYFVPIAKLSFGVGRSLTIKKGASMLVYSLPNWEADLGLC